jgi:hypothetical protein
MATQYAFGKIVTSGLVFALDAADKNSYPGSGTIWNDLSGNNNSGSLVNGPTFNSANGGSIVFDGVDDRISVSDFNYGRSGCTVASWAKYNATTTGYKEGIVSKWQTGAGTANEFILGSTQGIEGTVPGNPYFYIFNSNNQSVGAIDNSTILVVGSWYYILGTFDGLNTRIYLNGQYKSISTNSTSATIKTVASQPIALASFGSTFQFNTNCNISLAQIYNRPLAASEILQNYNAQKSRFNL